MRVLIVTNMYPYEQYPYYGVFVQEQEISLQRLGLEVNVAIHLGRISKWHYVSGLIDLVGRLRAQSFDLVQTHHTFSTILALVAFRLARTRVPIVQGFHEGEVLGRIRGKGRWWRVHNWMWLKAFALRRVDFAILAQRHMLRAVLGDDATPIPSRLIPFGVDLEQFRPEDRDTVRRQLGWTDNGPAFLFPYGPRHAAKRYDLAQAAFKLVKRHYPQARLVVGGQIPHSEMAHIICACDAVLALSNYEASPTVVKEALACERPVVATDVGDIRESYGQLPGVLLCAPIAQDIAEKMHRALAVPVPYGGRCRLRELKLGLDDVARRVVEVYQQVLGPQAKRRHVVRR